MEQRNKKLKNLLLSEAIGDIAGMPYEFEGRTKVYNKVNLLYLGNDYTDDTVCTFACAEALLHHKDMAETLWRRGREDFYRGFGGRYAKWLAAREVGPSYHSFGNGSAMRCSAAGFMAKTKEECINLATQTAKPTHDHPEGIKGAVSTALAIHYAILGEDKDFIRKNVLDEYYTDCLKLAIALGGDADTLAAIAGPMAYAFYKEMPEELVENAKRKLPKWMLDINDEFDEYSLVIERNA